MVRNALVALIIALLALYAVVLIRDLMKNRGRIKTEPGNPLLIAFVSPVIMFIATLGIAVPGFVVATILMFSFGVKLHILPTYGLSSPLHYILPVVALSFYPTAYISRLMRSSMLDVLGQDYMRTAKAKGISQFVLLFKHALRNAVLPVITYLGPMLAYILTGSFVVEKIFTIPGLGSQFISSI
jgi:oligopeptide transport system permease protein